MLVPPLCISPRFFCVLSLNRPPGWVCCAVCLFFLFAPPFLFLPPDLGACSTSLSSKRDITTIPERRQGTLALNP